MACLFSLIVRICLLSLVLSSFIIMCLHVDFFELSCLGFLFLLKSLNFHLFKQFWLLFLKLLLLYYFFSLSDFNYVKLSMGLCMSFAFFSMCFNCFPLCISVWTFPFDLCSSSLVLSSLVFNLF